VEQVVRTVRLHHRYSGTAGEVEALEGIDLTVRRGEFLVILGPHCSGTSKLAQHMNAPVAPTAAEV